MHLKKLELTGFKSFADKIALELAPGMNAVVGPNGSGKSNIADALRWVLGEQSAKQLRGGKMEDIIFNGTAHRKPLGYAEITMRLDNSDHALPIDYTELSVTRRVYRSGESEYAINGETCRLRDIQHLFMDTGVGRDGYSIIGQGRIDEILSLRSEDRRHVFEEAAGISKYKARRTEAANKLEREKQNRERVDDIIAELQEQLEPLEAQSEEARKYLEMRDEYKSIHINIFLEDIRKINDDLEHTTTALNNILANSEDGKRLLAEARTAGEELKNRAQAAEIGYRRATESVLETTTAIEQCQSEIKLAQSRKEQLENEIARLQAEAKKREASTVANIETTTKVTESINEITAKLQNLQAELNEQLEIHAKHDSAIRESVAETDALSHAVMEAMNAETTARAAALEAENAYTRLEDDKERINATIEQTEEKTTETQTAKTQTESALTTTQTEIQKARNTLQNHETAYRALRTESETLSTKIRETEESLTATRGRYRALSEMEANQEGYYRSVKAVLSQKTTNPKFRGICGAISELIGVPHEYETAIEIALGGAAQNIITQTEDDAKTAIEYLKTTKAGRATFLPLSAVRGKNIDTARLHNQQGFISTAAELVQTENTYAQVISQLLGDIIIVDTLDNALAIHKKFAYSYKIVTKSGERLSPGGAITGGSIARQSAGIIGRARQIETLQTQVADLEKTLTTLQTKQTDLNEKRATSREIMAKTREHAASLQLQEQTLRGKLTDTQAALTSLKQTAAQLNTENDQIMQRIIDANTAAREANTTLKAAEQNTIKARAALENYQIEIEKNRALSTEESDIITDLRIEISTLTEREEHHKQEIERLKHEINILTQEKTLLEKEKAANQAALTKTNENQATAEEKLQKLQTRLEEAKTELKTAETDKAAIDTAITKAESDERAQTDAAALTEREIARLEARKENLDASSLRLHNEIWEEYGLTYQNAQPYKRSDLSESALRKTGSTLKAELAQMTNVNIGAIEAYKQIKTKHGFLTTQRDDIVKAEEQLHELIANLTKQMETQFAERFEVIAAHFGDVFKEMFDGGRASLRLLDTENVLESGIEIIAQPPGKSLQNLMLLSGGERALTAIALLFAILRMKPSPFCVLDEIESALDDANVTRFANFLKQYAKGTQFIIITHRKGTMEAADNMYGITMEEQGISKLVSVRFVE